MSRTLLGVDAGGTSSVAVIGELSPDGKIVELGHGASGPGNPKPVGWDQAYSNIASAIAEARRAGKIQGVVHSACLGVAGCGRPKEREQLAAQCLKDQIAENVVVVDDGRIVLRAGIDDGIGVAIIAGTGSFFCGRNQFDETGRVGGWGHILGDEGSAYDLGLWGLKAVVHANDGLIEPTTLSSDVLQACSIQTASDLIGVIYQTPFDKRLVARLADIVLRHAEKGDAAAVRIVDSAVHSLAQSARYLANRLKLAEPSFCFAGGLLVNSDFYRGRLIQPLGVSDGNVRIVDRPEIGALLMASELPFEWTAEE